MFNEDFFSINKFVTGMATMNYYTYSYYRDIIKCVP